MKTILMLLLLTSTALAQDGAVVTTAIDFGPMVNAIIGLLAMVVTTLLIPLLFAYIGKTLKAWGVEAAVELAATRAVVDSVVQKAIGQTITKYDIKPGMLTVDTKSTIIADAANTIVKNAAESLKKLGVPENEKVEAAREMVMSRLGLMEATAAGTPVPNPSQAPPAAPAPLPVNPVG